jgi:hypothetical protein
MSQIKVTVNCGVKPQTFTYRWDDISPGYVRNKTAIVDENGDIFFLKTDGTEIYHPKNNIVVVEIGPRPQWTLDSAE